MSSEFPIWNFVKTAYSVYDIHNEELDKSGVAKKIFERSTTFSKESKNNEFKCSNCNVIIIFAEGTSRRVLSESLTPNVIKLEKTNSVSFVNYYNHTAATFRGITGTLSSSASRAAGYYQDGSGLGQASKEFLREKFTGLYESIASIADRNGYATEFLSPHAEYENMATIMKAIGFKKTVVAPKRDLTDRELYDRLIQEALELNKEKQPFLLTTYVVGTHHGMDSPDKKYGDGKNSYLNKFYNQDYWFGEFYKKFYETGLNRNTILIFTADHATYPVPEYKKTFNTKVNVFHDQIPLIIHREGIKSRIEDAKYRSSLTFAPTICQILGFKEEKNHFLGNSLFEKGNEIEGYAFQGDALFRIERDGIVRPTKNRRIMKILKNFYSFSG